jgi:hypothetical protein
LTLGVIRLEVCRPEQKRLVKFQEEERTDIEKITTGNIQSFNVEQSDGGTREFSWLKVED